MSMTDEERQRVQSLRARKPKIKLKTRTVAPQQDPGTETDNATKPESPVDTGVAAVDVFRDPASADNQVLAPVPADAPDEDDPELRNIAEQLGGRTTRIMRKAVEYAKAHQHTATGESMLDDTIMTMRQSGLSPRRIAAELGGTISEEEVSRRLAVMYAKMEKVTSSEYRMLQVARLEGVINMCYAYAEDGSEGHIELLLKAIERLNKMFELETEKTKIEVEIVTDAQAVLLMGIVSGVLNIIAGDPRVTQAIPREELTALTAEALDAAEKMVVDGSAQTIQIDT